MSDEQKLEEQALSKVAEMGISSQLDQADKINVNVQTDLLKMVQGQVDGVAFSGEGLVIQKDIRVQEIKLQTDTVAINPFSALFGQIEFNQPVNATARIVMTEADINRALTSEYIRSQMQNFHLNVDEENVKLSPEKLEIKLPGNSKIGCMGIILLQEKSTTRRISFTAKIQPRTLRQPLLLESFTCTEGGGISLEIIASLMQRIKELVNQPYFELENMALHVQDMEIEEGSLKVLADASVRQLPSA